jgi:hypothetical protein
MTNSAEQQQQQERKKYVEAWNRTMVDIWEDRISRLKVIDTGRLYRSVRALAIKTDADGRFLDFSISEEFQEYGLWQDLGTGRETPIGNHGDIGKTKVRQKKRWESPRYYSSVMNLRDFMADNLGEEYKGIICDCLDADRLRKRSKYYNTKGVL